MSAADLNSGPKLQQRRKFLSRSLFRAMSVSQQNSVSSGFSEIGRRPSEADPKQRVRTDSKGVILTSLDPGTPYNIRPKKMEGFLAKKRKWPLKGWHKR